MSTQPTGSLTVGEGFWSELERSQQAVMREAAAASDRRVAEMLRAGVPSVPTFSELVSGRELDSYAEQIYEAEPRRDGETDQQLRSRMSDMGQRLTPTTGHSVAGMQFRLGDGSWSPELRNLEYHDTIDSILVSGTSNEAAAAPFTVDGVEADPEAADHDLPLLLPLIGRTVGVEELVGLTRQLSHGRRLQKRQDEDGVVVAWTKERRQGDVVVV